MRKNPLNKYKDNGLFRSRYFMGTPKGKRLDIKNLSKIPFAYDKSNLSRKAKTTLKS